MAKITIKQLLEAGVHFGHQTQRWNPKMKKYIFGERNGIYIINLEITLSCIEKGLEFLEKLTAEGKEVLFVGTKKQAQDCIREAAEMCEMPYVNQRWLGGMLTNFETVRKSLGRLESIDRMEQDGSFQFVTKKEAGMLRKEREKLAKNLTGIRAMRKLPGAIFVIDSKKEEIAIREAKKLGIPVVAVLDTNCDPDLVDYPFPGNDDAIRAIKLFCDMVASAVKLGRNRFKKIIVEQETAKAQAEAEAEAAEEKARAEEAGEALPAEAAETEPVTVTQVDDLDLAVNQKVADLVQDEKKFQKIKSTKKPLRRDASR